MKISKQIVKRGQIPSKDVLISLYENHTLQEIAEIYGTTKQRVRKWFDILEIVKRSRGGGNNRKVIDDVTCEQLVSYVTSKLSNKEISKIIGCSVSNVARLLNRYKIYREYDTNEYQKYCKQVRLLSEKNYVAYYDEINPDKYPRTLCGVEGGYQLDHIRSVRECYDMQISAEECSSRTNLQIITWEENLQRRKFTKRSV